MCDHGAAEQFLRPASDPHIERASLNRFRVGIVGWSERQPLNPAISRTPPRLPQRSRRRPEFRFSTNWALCSLPHQPPARRPRHEPGASNPSCCRVARRAVSASWIDSDAYAPPDAGHVDARPGGVVEYGASCVVPPMRYRRSPGRRDGCHPASRALLLHRRAGRRRPLQCTASSLRYNQFVGVVGQREYCQRSSSGERDRPHLALGIKPTLGSARSAGNLRSL